MLQYGLAEDTSRSGGQDNAPSDLYSQSAIYVAAAHALKPNYSVWGFLQLPLCCLPFSLLVLHKTLEIWHCYFTQFSHHFKRRKYMLVYNSNICCNYWIIRITTPTENAVVLRMQCRFIAVLYG